jgi:hypothetical protein
MHHTTPITRRTHLLLTTTLTTIILATTITTAHAERLEFSNNTIRAIWSSLELSNIVTSETVRCAVTLEGSFHSRTVEKIGGRLVGYITRGNIQNNQCTGGNATVLSETLPWHLTYSNFRGTLPRIENVLMNLIRFGFIIRTAANTCRAITEIFRPFRGIINLNTTNGRVEGLRADETAGISLSNGPGGALCGFGTSKFQGTAPVTQLGSTASISMTLAGTPPPPVELDPSPVRFGTVEPGELSRRTVTIRNIGASVTINSIRVATGNFFAITDPNSCVRSRLAEAARCAFSVIFAAPSEAGRPVRDTVTVETTGGSVEDLVEGST